MERFKRFAAAFMLAVFVTSMVGSWTHQAKAQIPGLSDIIAGAVKGIGEDIFGTGAEVAKLALILEEVAGMRKNMQEKTEKIASFAETMRNSFYVLNSLRIIESYASDVSQFVSNVVTGKFYNLRAAVYSAQVALNDVKYLGDCIADLRSLLSKNHGSEGESSSKQTVIMTVHDTIQKAYKSFQDTRGAMLYEDKQLAQDEFKKAMFAYNVLGDSGPLIRWFDLNGYKFGL